jgi:secondary thiamine-phosphate synthase enzyme
MAVYHEHFELHTEARPSFHDVTQQVREIVSRSNIKDGIALVYSQHTTCSVMVQEESFDETYAGVKYIHQDLLDIFDELIPVCKKEGDYLHPGPKLVKHSWEAIQELPAWCLNTDAHLRSALMGRSQSIPIIKSKLELGEFGQIYFIDFDGVRERDRIVRVQIVGD